MVLVHPEARGRGIGTALLEHCLESLRVRGVPCVKLDATPEGEPLYEKLGFRREWPLARWEGVPDPRCFISGGEVRMFYPGRADATTFIIRMGKNRYTRF